MRSNRMNKVEEASDREKIKKSRHLQGSKEAHTTDGTHDKVRRMTNRAETS